MASDGQTVKLKNGSEEVQSLVSTIMYCLNKLMEEGQIIMIYELVELCRDPQHEIWGVTIVLDLEKLSLVNIGPDRVPRVHNSIRNIVLSAVQGEGMDITLGNPVEENSTPCEHEPAFTTVTPADADIQGNGRWIFDVNCKHCGISGSFAVDTNTEIDW